MIRLMFDANILLTGLVIFVARICDVSIGTVRTIITVQGRTTIAFFLATFEIIIWVLVASTVISKPSRLEISLARARTVFSIPPTTG